MTTKQSHDDGSLSDDDRRWLSSCARGGFGLVPTGATHVSTDGRHGVGSPGLYDDVLLPGWIDLARELRDEGALALAQISHVGLRGDPSVTGAELLSASESPSIGPQPKSIARAATEEDLARVVAQFAKAAMRAKSAGLDGVEIHCAHGFLLAQFLSTTMNRRDDGWGGPLENRARLARQVVRAVRAAVGASFVVGVRVSPEDPPVGKRLLKGFDLDESVAVARWLSDDGVDYVHLSLWEALKNTVKRPTEHALALFRAALPRDVPILAAGSVWTRAEAERVLALGADVVTLGRCAIANPDWPSSARDPEWAPKTPPVPVGELHRRRLGAPFVEYLKEPKWGGFVTP